MCAEKKIVGAMKKNNVVCICLSVCAFFRPIKLCSFNLLQIKSKYSDMQNRLSTRDAFISKPDAIWRRTDWQLTRNCLTDWRHLTQTDWQLARNCLSDWRHLTTDWLTDGLTHKRCACGSIADKYKSLARQAVANPTPNPNTNLPAFLLSIWN